MPWELKVPVDVPINIDVQCYPFERQIPRIRRPIHDLAMEMLEHGELKPYQIAQALDSVGQFWERFASGDADLADFEDDFDGQKRRDRKKAQKWLEHAISILEPGDQCPVCKTDHVAIDSEYNIVCVGACGVVRPAPEAVCESCGEECTYHPEVCLCQKCEAEGEQDAEAEGSTNDDRGEHPEEEDQGAR